MSQENVEVVRAVFPAWNAGDMDAVRELNDPDVILATGLEGWPEQGPFVGREALMHYFEQLRETWAADAVEPVSDFIDTADHVVVRVRWRGVGEGPESSIEFTIVFTVRKHRIFLVENFWDHTEALEAVGLSEQAMSQENVEVVRELFERFGDVEFGQLRGALETSSSLPEAAAKMGDLGRWFLDRLHPEAELDASALPALPDEGNRAQGRQGWFEFWRTWLTPWEEFEYTPKRWHDAGHRVVVELVQRGRLAGGLKYATPVSNVWTFDGEKVIRLQMFGTWAEALEAAGLPGQDAHADS